MKLNELRICAEPDCAYMSTCEPETVARHLREAHRLGMQQGGYTSVTAFVDDHTVVRELADVAKYWDFKDIPLPSRWLKRLAAAERKRKAAEVRVALPAMSDGCPRCGGRLYNHDDAHGKCMACLMCGWTSDVLNAMPDAALEIERGGRSPGSRNWR